jgi:septum formation protein
MTAATFVLASRSPRRVQLLREQGYAFDCLPVDLPEVPAPGEAPLAYARRLALDKARAAHARSGRPALGADTDVSLDGRILGKPRDAEDACAMLLSLSGRSHQVISAVALVDGAREALVATVTEVEFASLTRAQALAYWATGEPADKAGAYAIQGLGGRHVRALRGSYSGVVGLPLAETAELLAQFGIHPEPAAAG